jgi:hypothetical protein
MVRGDEEKRERWELVSKYEKKVENNQKSLKNE